MGNFEYLIMLFLMAPGFLGAVVAGLVMVGWSLSAPVLQEPKARGQTADVVEARSPTGLDPAYIMFVIAWLTTPVWVFVAAGVGLGNGLFWLALPLASYPFSLLAWITTGFSRKHPEGSEAAWRRKFCVIHAGSAFILSLPVAVLTVLGIALGLAGSMSMSGK